MASKLCLVALLNQGSPEDLEGDEEQQREPGGHEDLAEHEECAP